MQLSIPQGTEGVHYSLDAAEYHRAPGVSSTMLRHLARSPAHLDAELAQPREQSPAMLFGSIVHQLVLEPAKPWTWAIKPPDLDLRSKEGKAWREAVGNKAVLPYEDWLKVEGVVQAVRSHPIAAQAFASGKAEVSVFRNFSYGGTVLRKARIDFVNDGDAIVDLKTVEDARPEAFARTVHSLKYYLQGAYYLDIWNDAKPEQRKQAFVIVAVEKQPPFALRVYNLAREAIEKGRGEYIHLLGTYMDCRESGQWPAYPEEITNLSLPRWAA